MLKVESRVIVQPLTAVSFCGFNPVRNSQVCTAWHPLVQLIDGWSDRARAIPGGRDSLRLRCNALTELRIPTKLQP